MKHYSKALAFLIFFFANLICANAQSTIKGEVLDKFSKEPLIGANVASMAFEIGTVTDWDGTFILDLEGQKNIEIEFSYLGYETQTLTVSPGDKIIILLKKSSVLIEGVEVKGQRISDKQKTSPLSIESLDIFSIKETASSNFYDGLVP